METIYEKLNQIKDILKQMSLDQKVETINLIRKEIHDISPFKHEPVDLVTWVKKDNVIQNDYNPNSVAPPEMQLLYLSIKEDGYTQPIVTMIDDNRIEVIDGFHRHRVGKEYEDIRERIHGYLPVVKINEDRADKADRMASTIRHNRARGKHSVTAMSDIVIELKRRMWNNEKIAKHLGMDADEVLRLSQISGLTEIFGDQEFSKAWEGIDNENEIINEL
jgi:ParB-like chromosome segregation protein Spo0J